MASADHFSLSLSLLLSWDVRPLSELANFVFTIHSVGCREKEKKKRKDFLKKIEKKPLIAKPECSKQRKGEKKKLCFYIIFKTKKKNQQTNKTRRGKRGAGIYHQ